MIKQFNGYKPEKMTSSQPLPVGGHVLNIMKVNLETTRSGGQMLVINFDVAEGENAGGFMKLWKEDTRNDKKWKGVYRLSVPTGDGSTNDTYAIRGFNNFVACVEESNPGYHWNWDENGLKNLKIGGVWRNKEYEIEGRTGWTTEMGAVVTVDDVRNGTFKMLKDKPLSNKQNTSAVSSWGAGSGWGTSSGGGFSELSANEDDLPF